MPDKPAELAEDLKPSAMRGSERLYGYVVALELVGVGVANLTVTHGKGAPAHPDTTLSAVGLGLSVALLGLLQTRNRLVAAFGCIIAAYLVAIPKVPDRLGAAHLLALVIPVIYAIVLTQRQRKAARAELRAAKGTSGADAKAPPGRGARPAPTKSDQPVSRRWGRKSQAPAPSGPAPSRRYTPPKAKRSGRR